MADLTEALDAALRGFYPIGEPKSPITSRRGLLARMNQLEKLTKAKAGRTAAAAAAAAGIPVRTWRDWRAGRHTPGAVNLDRLKTSYGTLIGSPKTGAAIARKGTPGHIRITAVVVFSPQGARYVNKHNSSKHAAKPQGYRVFNADSLTDGDRRQVVDEWFINGPGPAAEKLLERCGERYDPVAFEGDDVEVRVW